MSRLPLRIRLTLAFAVVMAALLAVTGAYLYVRLQGTLDEQIDHSLRARVDDVAALVRRSDSGLGDRGRLAEGDESFAQVLDADGAVRDATPPLGERPLLTRRQLSEAWQGTISVDHAAIAGLDEARTRLLAAPAGSSIVVAGTSLEDRDEALADLKEQLLIGGPIALLVASLAGYALARATLRPVEEMRSRAEDISSTVGGRRLPEPGGGDEVARLARTLNEMLARIEAGVERERRFVAEASHELRTPLASLKAELELALRRPRSREEMQAAIASAAEETDRLAALAEDLLVLARSDEGGLRLEPEPLSARGLLTVVAARFAARAEDAGVELEVSAPRGLQLVGDRARLEQALGNLVDNALRHGAGFVRLEAAREDGSVALRVSDGGRGFPSDLLPRAFERFSRAAEARSRDGAGLGLAIVHVIAQAHEADAVATNLPGGGARVTLSLPAG
jgi:two-component system, OmpR family, sensor kinase